MRGIWAAGDLAHWNNATFGSVMRLENWTNAADQGIQAGKNAAHPAQQQTYTTVPYFWSDWYGQRIQFVGTAVAESVEFISGGPDADRFIAVYSTGGRLVGAATLDERRAIMKLRRHIDQGGSVDTVSAVIPASQPAA